MQFRTIFKSFLSLIVAITCALLVGSMIGWSTNPEQNAAFEYAADKMARSGFYGTEKEVSDKFLEYAQKDPSYYAEEPNKYIAILKSNPLLLGAFSFVGLVLFRPPRNSALVVFAPLAGISMFGVNLLAGISILLCLAVFIGLGVVYPRLRNDKAT